MRESIRLRALSLALLSVLPASSSGGLPVLRPHTAAVVAVAAAASVLSRSSLAGAVSAAVAPDGESMEVQMLWPEHYDEFIHRRCQRPTAVLFAVGDGGQADASAVELFEGVAEFFKGTACFALLRCKDSRDFCEDQNVKRTPTVVLYPGRPGAAVKSFGGVLDKDRVMNALSQYIKSQSSHIHHVSAESLTEFVHDRSRPFKAVFFSQRKVPPVILQAIAGDTQLVQSVSIGFVLNTEKQVLRHFGVPEVPYIVFQYMGDETTRSIFKGESMDFLSVRAWLRGEFQRTSREEHERRLMSGAVPLEAFSQEEVSEVLKSSMSAGSSLFARRPTPVFRELGAWGNADNALLASGDEVVMTGAPESSAGATWVPIAPSGYVELSALSIEREVPQAPPAPEYQQLPYGTKECPPGLAVMTAEECEAAIVGLGLSAQPSWVSNFAGLPSHCSIREKTDKSNSERMHFNSAKNGAGRADLAPVCRTSPLGADSDATEAERAAASAAASAAAAAAAAKGRPGGAPAGGSGSADSKAQAAQPRRSAKGGGGGGRDKVAEPSVHVTTADVTDATAEKLTEEERAAQPGYGGKVVPATRPAAYSSTSSSQSAAAPASSGMSASSSSSSSSAEKADKGEAVEGAEGGGRDGAASQRAEKPEKASGAQEAKSAMKYSAYQLMGYGADGCPPGLEIRSVEECERAILSLGFVSRPAWISAFPGVPTLCSVRESTSAGSAERMHFNSLADGQGRQDLAPVCKKPSPNSAAGADLESAAQDAEQRARLAVATLVPELTGATQSELLAGSDVLCLVYLVEGPVSLQEALMLRTLDSELRPRLKESGSSFSEVRWMWLDLRMERKLRAIWDPPVLPSAVALAPGREGSGPDAGMAASPQFSAMEHREEEGEPQPADAASLELLINTVLGGDAAFTPVPPRRLMQNWAKRSRSGDDQKP